ncbi:MAG: hypothetical protein ACRDMV_19680 [Streptosporangiales bacterium]
MYDCPACGLPAEVNYARIARSTDGPMEHVHIQCPRRHWYLLPVAWLPPAPADSAEAVAARQPYAQPS